MTKEDKYQIAEAIERHVKAEENQYIRNKARSRAFCTISNCDKQLWITNSENNGGWKAVTDITGHIRDTVVTRPSTLTGDGTVVSKNSLFGGFLIQHPSGTHVYYSPAGQVNVTIHNLTSYAPYSTDPTEVEIRMGEDTLRYQRLSDIKKEKDKKLRDIERKRQEERLALEEIERKKRLLAEQQAKAEKELAEQKARAEKELAEKKAREEREAAERKAREERERAERLAKEEEERIQAEIRQKEEQAKKIKEEREKNERGLAELAEEERRTRSFLRRNATLRYQHLLDPCQDKAKRSHIFDGIPIVIEGGPGTGKTTTIIQRLKFLLSYDALSQYREIGETKLTLKQIEMLVDPNTVNDHWMFFSPTTLLLHYLRDSMLTEGLIANDDTTRTLQKYRDKLMLDYQLKDSSKSAPFKDYKVKDGEERLILKPKAAIDGFTKYLIAYCKKILVGRSELSTSQYPWHSDSIGIKAYCSRAKDIKTLDELIELFFQLNANERNNTRQWAKSLSEMLSDAATRLKMDVMTDSDMTYKIQTLFDKWRTDRRAQSEAEEEASEDEVAIDGEEENEPESFSAEHFENQLYSQLRKLLRNIGLNICDNKNKIPKRTAELYDIIRSKVDETAYNLKGIGETAMFLKLYANLTNGVESNVFSIIPRIYKAYRKEQNDETISNGPYKITLLDRIIKKGEGKHLHPDEQDLVLGFINEMLYRLYQKSNSRFAALKHKYVEAYKNSVKYVIGIDEATDYSIMDYYFMVSLRHYEFSSITLCGDLMQGLNSNGISDWDELKKFVLPKLEVKPLEVSYRQSPTLLDVARGLYHDDMGEYPPYFSKEKPDRDAAPLLLINSDMEEKIQWICERIVDIHRQYDELLPSIAIFVGDDVDIDDFVEQMNDLDILPVEVVNCSGDRQLQNKEVIRVFRLSDVKGMEFEAAFFYDIDTALGTRSEKMMRRYLYVGISRATSHLAATMSRDVMKNIQKYFETTFLEWPLV